MTNSGKARPLSSQMALPPPVGILFLPDVWIQLFLSLTHTFPSLPLRALDAKKEDAYHCRVYDAHMEPEAVHYTHERGPQHSLDRAVRTSTASYLSAELLPRGTAVLDKLWMVLGFHWLLLKMVHTQWKQLQIFNSNRKIKARCGS